MECAFQLLRLTCLENICLFANFPDEALGSKRQEVSCLALAVDIPHLMWRFQTVTSCVPYERIPHRPYHKNFIPFSNTTGRSYACERVLKL